jgi:hypothetical protein
MPLLDKNKRKTSMTRANESRTAKLIVLAQGAASKADVLERFKKASGVFERFGDRISRASRRAIAACGLSALGVGLGVALVSLPQSLLLAPLLGIGAGSLGALLARPTLTEARDDEVRKLEGRIDYATSRGLTDAVTALERHYVTLVVADTKDLTRLVGPQPRKALPPASQSHDQTVDEADVVDAEIVSS